MIKPREFPAKARQWAQEAKSNPAFWPALSAAGLLAAFDQLTKYIIVYVVDLPARGKIELSRIFDLTYVENRGASFGMLAGGMSSRIFLSLVSTAVSIGLIIWLARLRRIEAVIGVALIVGGAVGNLVDRVMLGFVVDFFDFSGLGFPWVFNIADASINVGIAFLLLDAWRTRDGATPPKPSAKKP